MRNPRNELNKTSLLSLSLSFLNSHEATNVGRKRGWPCNLSHNRTDVYVPFSLPLSSSLCPSPKLYINYALFRTRPTRLYFRSNRKTTPERERTMALIYFSNLTNLPPPSSTTMGRRFTIHRIRPSPPPPFSTRPLFFPLRAFAPTEETNIKGRELKVYFTTGGHETLILPLPPSSHSVLELIRRPSLGRIAEN